MELTELQTHFRFRFVPLNVLGALGMAGWQYGHGDFRAAIGAGLFAYALLNSLSEIVYQLLVIADAQHPN